MTELNAEDLAGSRFEHVSLAGARFRDVDLSGARFQLVDLSGVRDASTSRSYSIHLTGVGVS